MQPLLIAASFRVSEQFLGPHLFPGHDDKGGSTRETFAQFLTGTTACYVSVMGGCTGTGRDSEWQTASCHKYTQVAWNLGQAYGEDAADLPSAHLSLALFAGSGHQNGTVWLRIRVGSKENSVFSSRQDLTTSKMDMVEEVHNVDACIHLKERPWLQHGMAGWTACL